jgi:hypothetical protein
MCQAELRCALLRRSRVTRQPRAKINTAMSLLASNFPLLRRLIAHQAIPASILNIDKSTRCGNDTV